MARIKIKVIRLPHAQGLELPTYQTSGAAGMDLMAAVGEGRPTSIAPGKRALIPTGLILELPRGHEAQVRPRSGLALRNGITVLNAPGTIDSDYRGEVCVLLVNLSDTKFKIERGARIAQLIVQQVAQATLVEVTSAATTARGEGGFGSTGLRTATVKRPASAESTAAAKRPQLKKPRKISKTSAAKSAPKLAAKPAPKLAKASAARKARPPAPQGLTPANPQNRLRLDAHRRSAPAIRTRVSPR